MIGIVGEAQAAALMGLFGGVVLGLAARLGRFCTLGAIEDHLYLGSNARLLMWLLAIGTATLASFGAMSAGLLRAEETFYLGQGWSVHGAVIGGLIFGYGMALAGNCGYGALARLGGGDIRSFVIVLVMGLAAYATLSGPLAELRLLLFARDPAPSVTPGLAHLAALSTGTAPGVWGLGAGVLFVLMALWPWRGERLTAGGVFAGTSVGLAIASGWIGTQWLSQETFGAVPVVSHSFAAPLGETMLYMMISSGSTLSFGVGSVLGVLAGAFLGSLAKGQFRWEACEDPRELKRQMLGAAMMGCGAVVAAGCSVGQGLSAFSLLALSGPVTLASIWVGAALGLRHLIEGFAPAE